MLSRRMLYVVAGVVLTFLLFSIVYSYPTSLTARAKLVSQGGAMPLFSPVRGYVVKELAHTGDAVQQEQPLCVIEAPTGELLEIRSPAEGVYVPEAEQWAAKVAPKGSFSPPSWSRDRLRCSYMWNRGSLPKFGPGCRRT